MAFKTKNAKEAERVYFDLKANGAEVTNVKVINDTFITFTIKCKGFAFYNMRMSERKSDGKPFITVPQTKGSNGKFYDLYALYLSDADQEEMIDKVLKIVSES